MTRTGLVRVDPFERNPMRTSPIYALDIETFNGLLPNGKKAYGLDPAQSYITEIAVCGPDFGEVFALAGGDSANEADLLRGAAFYLSTLEPGIIATWNGRFFDLPFIHDRAVSNGLDVEKELGLTLSPRDDVQPKYDFLPGHDVGYEAFWTAHFGNHVTSDISFDFKEFAEMHGVKHSLKPTARAAGLNPIELDRERLHEYTDEERQAYALSDVRITRELALRLYPEGAIELDQRSENPHRIKA